MGSLYRRTSKGKYYAEWTDAHGRRVRRTTGTTNKQDASRILAGWESEANDRRHGLVRDVDLALEPLLIEYVAHRGGSEKHQQQTKARLRMIFRLTGWTRANQINQYELEKAVMGLVVEKTDKPAAARTRSHYLAAAKTFATWLTRVRKALRSDPLMAVSKPSFEHDRKLVRRFLLPGEWQWLAKTPNATLYHTAIETGLRASEVLALRPEHLRSDHVFLPGKHTKNKQDAKQYVTAALHEKLSSALPFIVPDRQRLANLLRGDLAIARELWLETKPEKKPAGWLLPEDALKQVLDFHALRHTCGAWLAISGVTPKVIQSVMRHSSISLTLDTYGHLMPGAEQDAVQHFARLMAVDL